MKGLLLAAALAVTLLRPMVAAAQATANPHGRLPEGMDCSACHTSEGWTPARADMAFRHDAVADFPLTGAHGQVPCRGCHLDLRFDEPRAAPTDCATCHADVHEGRMVDDCASCHTTTSFQDVDGEAVHLRTGFPLTGAHLQLTCESCHADDRGGAFSPLPSDCGSCHMADYREARSLDHVAGGLPTDCTTCHGTLAWADAPAFDHGALSGFELLGAHAAVACSGCHQVPGMAPLFEATSPRDCVACHRADFDREHPGSSLTTECLTCHTVDAWQAPDFDHGVTGFPLQGAHAGVECGSCHVDGHRALLFPAPAGPGDCVACHRADFDREHGGSGFPTTCLTCHTSDAWSGATFDHGGTGFPLVGAHGALDCAACHGGAGGTSLAGLPASPDDCVACHRPDYDGAHGGSGIPTTCGSCHTTSGWEGATADHALLSGGFQLVGAHASAACTACHQVPGYQLLFPAPAGQGDCVACHQSDYDGAHAGSGIPTTCGSCHTTSGWEGATADHALLSGGFQLVGAHASAACTACHQVPGYQLLFPAPAGQGDCVACHQSDFDGAHGGSGFPTTCETCHGTSSWASSFDHDAQYFPIYTGHHRGRWSSCATCHTSSTDFGAFSCLTCHEHAQSTMDEHHKEVKGYVYESSQCYACHGRA